MTVHIITGELGSGKSIMAVSRIQAALLEGRRVATNMDIRLERLVTSRKPRDVTRLPDFPTLDDLKSLGKGYEGRKFDEKRFGLIVLDEAAMFLNAREYQGAADSDKEERKKEAAARLKMIGFLRHVRKQRWHLILVTQDAESLDAQVRRALMEHRVDCRRLDSFSVPIVSLLTKSIGLGAVKLPQVHLGVVYYKGKHKVDTWWLPDAKLLHGAYDTQQKILGDNDGPATMLDASHAPYLWKPSGMYEALWELGLWRWFPPTMRRARYDDFRLYEQGKATPYKPPLPSYAEWWGLQEPRATS